MCWRIPQTAKLGKQRIKIQACDDDDINQKWNIIAGRLHPVDGERLCVGIQENLLDEAGNAGIAMTTIDCYPHMFGSGACAKSEGQDLIADADKAIRPMGQDDENLCFFKKYFAYNNGDEIWIKDCDAGNTNVNKAGKYWFSYDLESGRISLPGSVIKADGIEMCMRITNPDMVYKQRVRIAPCNPNDKNQRFDFVDGKIYSRENARVCAGYEYYKLLADGSATGTPLLFNTCYPNAWAITSANFDE